MQHPEHIIALGKTLAAEERAGCGDRSLPEGLDAYLTQWQAGAGEDLEHPFVKMSLAQLNGYRDMPIPKRKKRMEEALKMLRRLFRPEPEIETPPEPSAPVVEAQYQISPHEKLSAVPGIERKNLLAFKRLKLLTVEDLLYHFPHRYDDYSSQKSIADLVVGANETVMGIVEESRLVEQPRVRVEITLGDESGIIKAVFFNQRWLTKKIRVGDQIVLSGKVGIYGGVRQMSGPSWEYYRPDHDALIHTGRLVPVHWLTKGLPDHSVRKIVKYLVDVSVPHLQDHLPAALQESAKVLPLNQAIAQIHFPNSIQEVEQARIRLGFDEFLFIQLGVMQRKLLWQGELGYQMQHFPDVHAELLSHLPFALTGAQTRALNEIFADMARPAPMARLLQGDVGSGKTVVAAASLLQVIANGFQGALMAPTEILAEQHYKGLKRLLSQVRVPRQARAAVEGEDWRARLSSEEAAQLAEIKALLGMSVEDDMDGAGVRVALLTGSLGAKERRRVVEGIAKGEIDLIVGTHALITEHVQYHSLGLAVVDEQHRFGVEQRQRLRDKGFNPHLLVMTATPIPRTLTMTIYGDLDVSVLDELPPGRQTIRTRRISKHDRHKAYRHIRKEIEKGRQAFVICPLVEESDKINLPSAEEMHERLQSEIFPDLRVGLLHGKMLPRDKDQVMVAFRDREFDILVATAVIEVGIDIPNASTILIEGAERFGLSQLHQFRGRVGRGEHQSYCILIPHKENETSCERLDALANTSDGFRLAEIDLELRGPGEFFGTRQSGTPDLKIAQLTDVGLLKTASSIASTILTEDPQLALPQHTLLKQKIEAFWVEARKAG
ncbi:ATP-dependent DNA helicase RecG [Candidatus Oscillochloris fontis]|uniref:ATP-dependent DNA helicase RecG n=1 Tax=Candidatus Oscillochloris fontis TaxID=2496868 RepID=UPI00101BA5EE|nr:ATP-dependent DNA helicase RecG [Candidatus Oscillochloris fontis]